MVEINNSLASIVRPCGSYCCDGAARYPSVEAHGTGLKIVSRSCASCECDSNTITLHRVVRDAAQGGHLEDRIGDGIIMAAFSQVIGEQLGGAGNQVRRATTANTCSIEYSVPLDST